MVRSVGVRKKMEEVSGADERSEGMSRGWVWEVLGNEKGSFLESCGPDSQGWRGHTG